MNMRKGLNNASCFIIAPSDNLESIYNNFKNTAMISKSGGGLGFYAGYIRIFINCGDAKEKSNLPRFS